MKKINLTSQMNKIQYKKINHHGTDYCNQSLKQVGNEDYEAKMFRCGPGVVKIK